ncbi:cell envelope integrity protein CreD, partial [Pseudomonas laurentiana]|nr:cell envelope integrity protein CreD [Pseudomonas laurentiana]
MNRNLSVKLGAIAFLIVLLLVPLLMIGGLIQERQELRDGVVREIAQSSSFSQTLSGPLLVVPYRKIERQWKTPEGGGALYQDVKTVNGHLYFLPETFDLNARIDTELRSRGIYEARLYHAENRISGQFQIPVKLGLGSDFEDYTFDAPFLAVAISDIRGIEKGLKLDLNGQLMDFQPGTGLSWLSAGVHVALPALDSSNEVVLNYAFDLRLPR